SHNTIVLYSTGDKEWYDLSVFSEFVSIAYQLLFTILALLFNCGIIQSLLSRKQRVAQINVREYDHTISDYFQSHAHASAENGLALTTLQIFVTHLTYAIIMMCYSFPPNVLILAAAFITTDIISILPIWMLIACSRQVRRAVMEGICCIHRVKGDGIEATASSGWSRHVEFRLRRWRGQELRIT
ncbi:hypothetical protein PENTCL1PPCAC_15687, partial [Pristionchus entomophagus]